MRAGVLDQLPPVQVEAVLFEIILLLNLDAGHAEEGRELRRHGVGQIDHALEIALTLGSPGAGGRRCLLFVQRLGGNNGRGGKARGGGALEKSTPAERLQRLLASGNTHDRPPPFGASATLAS